MKNLNKGLIAEITGLAIDIQNAGIGTVFTSISGHVQTLGVRVFLGEEPKWQGLTRKADLDIVIAIAGQTYYDQPEYAIEKLTEILTNHTIHA